MKNNKGFTLIEMVVAIAVFTLVVGAATGLFVSGLRAQRQSLATYELLDQTSYLMEYMSRAVRMAWKDDITIGGLTNNCLSGDRVNYEFSGQCLKFRNYKNNCQQFCLDGDRIKDESGNYLTSDALQVLLFNVNILGQYQPPTDYLQPKITIFLDIKGKGLRPEDRPEIKIQSTVSQRNLDIRK